MILKKYPRFEKIYGYKSAIKAETTSESRSVFGFQVNIRHISERFLR